MDKNEILFLNETNKRKPNLDILEKLLKKGVNINVTDKDGETALFNVLNWFNEEKWKDENGNFAEGEENPIELVQKNVPKMDITIIKYLLEKGANPNIESKDGWRCLMDVVYTFRSDLFKLFMDHGADLNFKIESDIKFVDWINEELEQFTEENNKIAEIEISKMIKMINEYKAK